MYTKQLDNFHYHTVAISPSTNNHKPFKCTKTINDWFPIPTHKTEHSKNANLWHPEFNKCESVLPKLLNKLKNRSCIDSDLDPLHKANIIMAVIT